MKNLFIIIFLYFFISSCISSKSKIKSYELFPLEDFKNVNTEDCAWVYKNQLLNKNQIDSAKKIILLNNGIKIRTVSSVVDTLKKYNIKRSCVVILE